MRKLNIINIIQSLLPPTKRQPLMIAFLKVLTAPLQSLNNWIADVYYPDIIRRTKWNAQVMLFAKALNDLHNPDNYSERIYIDGGASDLEHTYFYNTVEETPIYFHNNEEQLYEYNFNMSEYSTAYDFVVYYPSALESKVKQIDTTVKKYKTVGSNYILQPF
jgi:hypothetical protein